jgi:hypothetical protein
MWTFSWIGGQRELPMVTRLTSRGYGRRQKSMIGESGKPSVFHPTLGEEKESLFSSGVPATFGTGTGDDS